MMSIISMVSITMTIVAISRLSRPLAIMSVSIAVVGIRVGMTVVSITWLGRSLAIMMSIISSIMIGRISIAIIARLSNSSGFGIGSRLGISCSFSISRSFAIVMSIITMVSIAVTVAMTIVAISRFSCSNAQNSNGDGNQKIHCCAFFKLRL